VNIVLGLLLLGLVFGDTLVTIVDPDLFHCLAYGRLLFASASFPRGDVFAYTPTIPRVIHHEWILGALHYLVVRRFGATGLLLLRLAVEGALVAGALGLACRRGARFPLLLLLGPLALAFMGPGLTVLGGPAGPRCARAASVRPAAPRRARCGAWRSPSRCGGIGTRRSSRRC
jgi:hypothetical protein